MTYEYIAGFFDGEGSIHISKQGTICVQICQAKVNNAVLYRIKDFLIADGIVCEVYHTPPRQKGVFKETWMSSVKFTAVDSVRKFIVSVMGLSYVKHAKLVVALNHIDSRQWNTKKAINDRLALATEDYVNGMAAVRAAKKNNLTWNVLRNHMRNQNIPIRGASESKKLWWSTLEPEKRQGCCAALDKYRNSHLSKNSPI